MQSAESEQLQSMIRGIDFFSITNKADEKKGAADYFRYKITLETKDNKHTVETTDMSMNPEFKDLIKFLSSKALHQNN